MASSVTLTYNGNDYIVYCDSITLSYKMNTVAKPNANGGSVVDVQTQSFDNPIYTLQNVHILYIGTSTGYLSYEDLIDMAKHNNTDSSKIRLKVNYAGNYTDTGAILRDSEKATDGIKVVLNSFNFSMNTSKKEMGSNQNHILIGTITLQETN